VFPGCREARSESPARKEVSTQMVRRILKKAVSTFRARVVSWSPFSGPPLERGLTMLSRQACESGGSGLDYANPGLSVSRIYCKMEDATHLMGGLNMNEVVMLDGARPKEILQTAIDKKITAIMSYLSKGKWHVAKIRLTDLTGERLSAESTALHLQRKQRPINIQVHQPVGISFKYEYGKFVFDATVSLPRAPTGGGLSSLRPRSASR